LNVGASMVPQRPPHCFVERIETTLPRAVRAIAALSNGINSAIVGRTVARAAATHRFAAALGSRQSAE